MQNSNKLKFCYVKFEKYNTDMVKNQNSNNINKYVFFFKSNKLMFVL